MQRTRDIIPLLVLIALVTWGAYAQVTGFEFVGLDDDDYVRSNRNVLGGLTAAGVRWAWTSGEASNWHPLTWMSHMLDVEWFGLDAGAHHRTSLWLHIASALLLFGAVRSLCRSVAVALLTALLFALHPLHVESVAWVSERKDVLSAAFGFGALWAYAVYARRGGAARYGLVLLAFAASLCSKATFVTLPFALLLLDVWPLGRLRGGPPPVSFGDTGDGEADEEPEDEEAPPRPPVGFMRLALEKLPLLALAATSSVVTFLVQSAGGATQSNVVIALPDRLANGVVSYAAYLAKTLVPQGMAMFYPHPSLGGRGGWSALVVGGAALLLIAITAATWKLRRRRPYLMVGWLWYLGTLVPMLGVVQVGAQAMADRYTYVPLVGVFLALSFGLLELVRARPQLTTAAISLSALVCVGCGVLTHRQAATWRDSEALARHALAVTENNWNAHGVLADWLHEQGRSEEALEHYNSALGENSGNASLHNNMGVCLFALERVDEAIEHYNDALSIKPTYAPAHNNLGRALSHREQFDAAEEHYLEALRLDPQFLDAHNNFGVDLARRGRLDEAETHLTAVLRSNPTPSQAFNAHMNLGLGYANRWEAAMQRGDAAAAQADQMRAAERFRTARMLDPTSELPPQLLRQLGFDS